MGRYQKKPRSHGEVELNMAAMLDMAFQLLAFFILTFRPSAVESQVSLRMPPAKAVDSGPGEVLDVTKDIDEKFEQQLDMTVQSGADGEIARISIGDAAISGQQPLDQVLANLSGMLAAKLAQGNFDGIALKASRDLLYERLMQVMDTCTRQTLSNGRPLTQISISEIGGG